MALLAVAPAQKKKVKFKKGYWKTDPYTLNDPAMMKKAGYVSYGPFMWGDDHDTIEIKKMFPHLKMLFVETAHFKIAIALGNYKLPKGKDRKRALEKQILKTQLKALKKIMPRIKPTTRELDPWLRLHIYAHRLELIYADFCTRVGVTDADFPKTGSKRISRFDKPNRLGNQDPVEYMGQGPYLGMRGKFLVMLMTKGGDLNRYVARARSGFQAKGAPTPQRHYFTKVGSLFFGTACECAENNLYNDHALHCHLIFNTVHSLIDGYKDYFFSLPVWNREGLSHWYLLRIDETEYCFTDVKGRSNKKRYGAKWPVRIKKRLKHDDFTPAAELMKFMAFDELTFGDHLAAWSRMDFLQTLGHEKFAKYMGALKNKIEVPSRKQPRTEQILAQQEKALQDAYGFDYAGFDAAWKEFVLKTYPNR
jgi:hypothetical protein